MKIEKLPTFGCFGSNVSQEYAIVDVYEENGEKVLLHQWFCEDIEKQEFTAKIREDSKGDRRTFIDLIVSFDKPQDCWNARFNISIIDKDRVLKKTQMPTDMLQATFRTKEDAYEASIRLAYKWNLYDRNKL